LSLLYGPSKCPLGRLQDVPQYTHVFLLALLCFFDATVFSENKDFFEYKDLYSNYTVYNTRFPEKSNMADGGHLELAG